MYNLKNKKKKMPMSSTGGMFYVFLMVSSTPMYKLGYRGLIMSLYKLQNLLYLTIHAYKHMYILGNKMYTQVILFFTVFRYNIIPTNISAYISLKKGHIQRLRRHSQNSVQGISLCYSQQQTGHSVGFKVHSPINIISHIPLSQSSFPT